MNTKTAKKSLLSVISSLLLAGGAYAETDSSTKKYDNFSDNNIDPFIVCTTQSPNTVQVVSQRVKATWKRSSYNDNRITKGAEACAELFITEKGRYQFTFNLPSSGSGTNGQPRYPSDKEAAIGQIFQNGDKCGGSWAALVVVKDNVLYFRHRASCGGYTQHELLSDITRNKDYRVEILFDPSRNNTGYLKVSVNGSSKVNETGISFGFADSGQWSGDNLANGAYLTGKFGQYAYDNGGYETNLNSIRTVYYDKVTWEKK